jgi:hypothetical protein
MSVNGSDIGEYSFKEGFETTVPITFAITTIATKLSLYSTTEELELNPSENYTYELAYHRMSGWFGFILYDNQGNELRRDKLHGGLWLLSFIIPIFGLIYGIVRWKKRPAASYTAIYAAILGVIISIIVAPRLKPLFDTIPHRSISSTDGLVAAVDSDSIAVVDVADDSNDILSEDFIKARMQEICDAFNSTDMSEERVVEKYFSSEFRKMYSTIDVLEKSGKGHDGLWYSGGFFNGSSEGVDKVSVGQIQSIYQDVASADFVYHSEGGDYTQTARFVLEDENWYIDDLCNRKSDMKEYINSMMYNDEEIATVDIADVDSATWE